MNEAASVQVMFWVKTLFQNNFKNPNRKGYTASIRECYGAYGG